MNNNYVLIIIEALIIYITIFLFNYLIFVRKHKKMTKNEMPLELIYLSNIYGINIKKINYRSFQYTYCFINSFIITSTYLAVIYLIKTMLMKVVIGIILLILQIIICYGLLGRYYLYKEQKSTKKSNK